MKYEIYKDTYITFTAGFYWALGRPFTTLARAKKLIDKLNEQYSHAG